MTRHHLLLVIGVISVVLLMGCNDQAGSSALETDTTATLSQDTLMAAPVGNMVVAMLDGAEQHYETNLQKYEMGQVLYDLLELPPSALRMARYSDDSGLSRRWTAAEVISAYFRPPQAVAFDEDRFYSEGRDSLARVLMKKHLAALNQGRQVDWSDSGDDHSN